MRRYIVFGAGIGLVLGFALWGCKKEKPIEVAQENKTQQWNLLYEYSFEDSSGNFLFSELGWSSCDVTSTTMDPDGYGCITSAQDGAPGYGTLSAEVDIRARTCLYNYYVPDGKIASYYMCPQDQDTGKYSYQIKAWIKLVSNVDSITIGISQSHHDISHVDGKSITFYNQPIGVWTEYTIEDTFNVKFNDWIFFDFEYFGTFRIDGVRIYKKKI